MLQRQLYPEGGWGWFIVLSAFLAEFIIFGSLKAFGVLLTAMKEDLETEMWIVGSISSLHFGVQFIITPLATAVARKVGSRYVISFGGVLYGLGLVLSSTTYNVAVLAVTIVLIAGIGAACTLETTRSEIAFYFHEKYAVASFVALAGGPIGMMIFGPVTRILLDTYGWRGAMLLIGGVGSNLIWVGLLVRRPTGVYASIPNRDPKTDDGDTAPSEQKQTCRSKLKLGRSFLSAVGLDLFLSVEFILLAVARMLNNIGYGGIVVYMVPNGVSLGLSLGEASILTTAYGVGSLAGLSLAALALHTHVLSCHATGAIAGCVTVAAFALYSFISTFIGQMTTTFIIGGSVHCIIQVVTVMTRGIPFGDDRFIIVLGWQGFLAGVATSLGDTISGWLYDATGSFHATFLMYSATTAAALLFLFVDFLRAVYIKRHHAKPL